ncbi:MAG: hypothetical protein LBT09_11345 [Planctomycetaceae bacterium]|jgi:hypothetical protein|nr:hypothetical protein [Planctomycetaceae bacterium]
MTDGINDNLELEEIDDELELESIEYDANKRIAPDVPFDAGVRLIPVICSACKTRLYAGEDQVGMWKRCPDCYRLTEIYAVPQRFILTADNPEAAGGYNLQDAEVATQDITRLKAENLNAFEADQNVHEQNRQENHIPPPVHFDKPPVWEGILNKLLKSNEEKKEENEIKQREKRIEDEVAAVKKAVMDGKLDEYLASAKNKEQKPIDPAERKRIEKQRQFDAAISSPMSSTSSTLSTSSASTSPSTSPRFFPPPPPPSPPTTSTSSLPLSTFPTPLVSSYSDLSDLRKFGFGSLWSPLFDVRCRARMIILLVCGFLGNLMGENARSMIWQVSVDRVYDQIPSYVYNWSDSGFLFVTFWFGGVLSLVWLCMLFSFGVSLFESAFGGRDRVDRWLPFNFDFGFYAGWLLILFISGFPGFVVWHLFVYFLPTLASQLIIIHYVGQFFCFPVLLLCVIESDTFYGNFPRKTLTSLYRHPLFWLKFYLKSAVLAGIPLMIIVGLMSAGTIFFEHRFLHSIEYYLIVSILLTANGFFVLFYFRLLGQTAWQIKQDKI